MRTRFSAVTAVFALTALIPNHAHAQSPPAILTVEIENLVEYLEDVADPAKYASTSTLTPGIPLRNFISVAGIGDIVSVNGQPAKGAAYFRGYVLGFSPTPNIEFALTDVQRTSLRHWTLDILRSDGAFLGTVQAEGPNGPNPPPGGPLSGTNGSFAVVGGTGAFFGVRGQLAQIRIPNVAGARLASMSENPAARRVNGGGRIRMVLQLIPYAVPQVVLTSAGPAVVHSGDFTQVTAVKPAAPGEILSIIATGLGPTTPGVEPGAPFPSNPLAATLSPIGVLVNGKPAEVLGAVGYPAAVDGYQVNFRVPSDASRGVVKVQLTSAWIPGPEVSINIQ